MSDLRCQVALAVEDISGGATILHSLKQAGIRQASQGFPGSGRCHPRSSRHFRRGNGPVAFHGQYPEKIDLGSAAEDLVEGQIRWTVQ